MRTKTRSGNPRALVAISILAACGLPAPLALAGPEDGDVVHGSAEFIFGDDYLRILTGEITIIDWLNFNIEAGYTVEFLMPGLTSRVLNRINSGVPTEIMGNLLANGQVFIVNPSGVIFGQGSVVNVGALYAAAGNLSNTDFIAGINRFTDARGIVENRGYLRGDLIALVGGRVANHGTISAPNGTIVMAAGEQVLIGEQLGRVFVQVEVPSGANADQLGSSGHAGLDMAAGDIFSLAAWNTGTIEGGSVTVHGGGGRTVVSGEINARQGQTGGDVLLLGQSVELRGAHIDASGELGGGSVVIGGNPHLDVNADRSDYVSIDEHSTVRADALTTGDGGSVVVWSDVSTNIDGLLTARGGSIAGDGGFIETSGLLGLRVSQMVDATAVNGRGGHWLIDPTNLIIAPGSLGSLGGWGPVDTAIIGVNLINAALNSGMDVTLTTFNPLGNGSGEIVQMENAQFRMLTGGEATLTLNAAGSILLHGGAYTAEGQSLNLVLNAADPNQPAPADPFSDGRIEINEALNLGGGSLFAIGNSIIVRTNNLSNTGLVSVNAGDIQLVARDAGSIRLGADMTATGGGILLDGVTTLTNDVTLTVLGGTGIEATGTVFSETGQFHDLDLLAGNGVITLAGGVGDTGDLRLGTLNAEAGLVRVGGDVRVLGDMNFYAPVSVFGDSVIFHTGLGTALFGGDLFAETAGATDVAFEYDGEAWAGVGEGRTPFKFQGSIGFAEETVRGLAGGAFRNIRFGNDLDGAPSVSTFLFANAAMAGLDLTSLSGTDLSSLFQIFATDSIRVGRGQKILSFGSLAMTAAGADSTLIEVGDLTVVGDLSLRSLGTSGQIRLLGRVAGTIDGQGNEDDRDQGGTADEGAELIAAGNILLEGSIIADPGSIAIGAGQVIIANETGTGDAAGLDIEIIEGGAGIERFLGTLGGTEDLLYAYDLAAFASPDGDSRANLAEAFSAEIGVPFREDERYLADARVLAELGFDPRTTVPPAPGGGPAEIIIPEEGVVRDPTGQAPAVAIVERFSPRSLVRLTRSYTALLGEPVGDSDRTETARVRAEITSLWNAWVAADRPEDLVGFAAFTDQERARTLLRLAAVVRSIDLLELTPAENAQARANLFARVGPESVAPSEFGDTWFPAPRPARAVAGR